MIQPGFWDNPENKTSQEIAPVPSASDGTLPDSWLGGIHPDAQLEVTSGFHLHAEKFRRILTYLAEEHQSGIGIYNQLTVATGMSRTQIKALVQYGVWMRLLVPRSLKVTPLGFLILKHDPFFDKAGTLWVLHYIMASNPLLLVWNYMCNSVLPSVPEISKVKAADQFLPFIGRWSEDSIHKNIRKELRAYFADYDLEIFANLNYLHEARPHIYTTNRDVVLVPPPIFYSCALINRDLFHPGASGVEIPILIYADNSPGRLMRQRETYVRQALDELHEAGLLTIESKANLDQIRYKSSITWLDTVRLYYQNSNP